MQRPCFPQARDPTIRPIIVGPDNSDPYSQHDDAIGCLAEHLGLTLDRASCYPYR